MIGTRLAHYEIVAHLGSGGMGDVYAANGSETRPAGGAEAAARQRCGGPIGWASARHASWRH